MRFDLTLYLVSDSTGLSEDEFLRRLEQALRGGVTLLQLREKNRTTLEYYELARKVKKLTDAYGVPLMIDDRSCSGCGWRPCRCRGYASQRSTQTHGAG